MDEVILKLLDLSKSFEGKKVLDAISLEVKEGEAVAILGKSGVGKTVLLKSMVGLLKADSGHIFFKGVDITRLKRKDLFAIRRHFGFVFQGSALFDSMTVYENIALPLEQRGLGRDEINIRVKTVLELVGLPGIENLLPHELSGGMKKRVGIARAFVTQPQIILYDEPTAGLDPVTGIRINHLIGELNRKRNVTAIVVTHDIRSATSICDRIVLLSQGKLVVDVHVKNIEEVEHPEFVEFLKSAKIQEVRNDKK